MKKLRIRLFSFPYFILWFFCVWGFDWKSETKKKSAFFKNIDRLALSLENLQLFRRMLKQAKKTIFEKTMDKARAGTTGCMYHEKLGSTNGHWETQPIMLKFHHLVTLYSKLERMGRTKYLFSQVKKKRKINFSEVCEKFSTENNFIQNNSKYRRLCCLKVPNYTLCICHFSSN